MIKQTLWKGAVSNVGKSCSPILLYFHSIYDYSVSTRMNVEKYNEILLPYKLTSDVIIDLL